MGWTAEEYARHNHSEIVPCVKALCPGYEEAGNLMSNAPKYQVRRTDGTPIPDGEPYWVFRARDELALPAIRGYRALAVAAGMSPEFLADIDTHIERITAWQNRHGTKRPD